MQRRHELHDKLKAILGSKEVHFQPPESVKLSYPCIIYNLDRIDTLYADDKGYKHMKRYTIIVIDRNPDTDIMYKILELPHSSFDRTYISNNLYHYVFTIFY